MTKVGAPKWVACALGLAAPCLLFAASAPNPSADDEQQLVHRIAEEQSARGPHSPQLVEAYTDLGTFYERVGQKALALAAFTQARGVVRANNGLSSLEEVPVLEALIRTQEATGLIEEPWQLEHELLALASAHPGDLRTVGIYAEIGDKRMAMLDAYVAGNFPPQLALGCYYERERAPEVDPSRPRNCTAGSRNALIRAVAKEAWGYYYSAIRVLLENRLYASDELRDLEAKIVRSAYREGAYRFGRASLRRSLSYDVANGESLLARIDSLLRIADWDIITTHVRRDRSVYDFALDAYRQAYEELTGQGVARSEIDALFSPEVPIVLPTFVDNPLVSTPTASSARYIDIAFRVTQYGYARHVEILRTTTSTSRETQKALVHTVSNSIFRPRVVAGTIAAEAPVVMRYYVND